MLKKGQAAMEFLMTYGWAILVVLAAIGALAYFGVLSPGNLLPQKCEFSAGLDCTEHPDATTTTVSFPVVNSLGYKIHLLTATSVDRTGAPNCNAMSTPAAETEVENSASQVITLGGCTYSAGERFSDTVTITYRSNSTGMTHSSVGTVAGKAR